MWWHRISFIIELLISLLVLSRVETFHIFARVLVKVNTVVNFHKTFKNKKTRVGWVSDEAAMFVGQVNKIAYSYNFCY